MLLYRDTRRGLQFRWIAAYQNESEKWQLEETRGIVGRPGTTAVRVYEGALVAIGAARRKRAAALRAGFSAASKWKRDTIAVRTDLCSIGSDEVALTVGFESIPQLAAILPQLGLHVRPSGRIYGGITYTFFYAPDADRVLPIVRACMSAAGHKAGATVVGIRKHRRREWTIIYPDQYSGVWDPKGNR